MKAAESKRRRDSARELADKILYKARKHGAVHAWLTPATGFTDAFVVPASDIPAQVAGIDSDRTYIGLIDEMDTHVRVAELIVSSKSKAKAYDRQVRLAKQLTAAMKATEDSMLTWRSQVSVK